MKRGFLQCSRCHAVAGELTEPAPAGWQPGPCIPCGGPVEVRDKNRNLVCELCEVERAAHQFEAWTGGSGPPTILNPLICAQCQFEHAYTMRRPAGWSEQVDPLTHHRVRCAEAVYSALKKEIAKCRLMNPTPRKRRPKTYPTGSASKALLPVCSTT